MHRSLLALAIAVSCTTAQAQKIYRCETPDGVVFSGTRCGSDAQEMAIKQGARAEPEATATAPAPSTTSAGDEGFRFSMLGTNDEIIEKMGPPAAKYAYRDTSRWLYPNRCESDGTCIELLLDEDGHVFQANYLPADVMQRAVIAAKAIGDWQPRPEQRHAFYAVSDTSPEGMTKSQVGARYGEPNHKKVFNGREIWEYDKIPMTPTSPETVTVYLEFEGDIVVSAVGN